MNDMNCIKERVCTSCPSFALMEEIRQLKGLRKVRLRTYGIGDPEINHLDEMIHTRLTRDEISALDARLGLREV